MRIITPQEEYLEISKIAIWEVWKKNYKDLNSRREKVASKIERLEQEGSKIIEMKTKDLLDDEDFKSEINRIKQKIQEEKITLVETTEEELNPKEAVSSVFNFISNIPDFWEKADCQQKIR